MDKEIKVICSNSVTDEMLLYIADCWVEFVVGDLGLEPKDLMILLPI